ncbi:MAG: HD domain-containing protein [Bacilli bacterium]
MNNKDIYSYYLKLISNNKIPDFLQKYLNIPSLLRLEKIGYFCGMDYASKNIYNFEEKISRYDHSLTVALLTWNFTKDKKATLAGLFHDIGTPCFSHVIDYMNKDYEIQESTEAFTENIIKNDKLLRKYLEENNIKVEDIIDFKKYTIVDNKRPKLCADRLDGIILTGYAWVKNLKKEDIKEIVDNLDIFINEDNEQELGFKTLKSARLAYDTSKKIDEYCHSKEDNYMMELLANITKKAINNNIIQYNDLFILYEDSLLNKIKNSGIKDLNEMLYEFENIKIEEIDDIKLENIKSRSLNPIINDKRLEDMEKVYNKLVRDNIPDIINKDNEIAITRTLNDDEYRKELYKKLLEESNEVIEAKDNEIMEELADVLEVMESIAKLENKSLNDIIDKAYEKRQKRGGFQKRIYLEKTIKK